MIISHNVLENHIKMIKVFVSEYWYYECFNFLILILKNLSYSDYWHDFQMFSFILNKFTLSFNL